MIIWLSIILMVLLLIRIFLGRAWPQIRCNLFHRGEWMGIQDFENAGLSGSDMAGAIHCLICDGDIGKKRPADLEVKDGWLWGAPKNLY